MALGCNSSGDPMGASGSGGSSGAADTTETDADDGTGGTPGATTGADETGPGDEASGGSSSGPSPECEEDEDCERGSRCLNGAAGGYCCYAIAWDGSCCESGQCFEPDECGPSDSDPKCDENEVCENGSCFETAPIDACAEPSLSPISLPIPGLGDAAALIFAETDGTAGAELVTVAGATVTVSDAVQTGIPTTTTLTVPGKANLVGVVAADLDADGLDELVVVDAEGTVTLLHALGASTYSAIQAIGSSLRPPLQIAELDAVAGPELIGLSDDGYTAFAIGGLMLDNVGEPAPKDVGGISFDLAVGPLLTATDLAVSDDDGVILVSSPDAQTRRVDHIGSAQFVAIRDLDGDGLSELAIALPNAEDTVVKSWSQEALAAEDGEALRQTLPFVVGAHGWGNIDGDAPVEWIVASGTAVEVVQFGSTTCRQVLVSEVDADLVSVGDVDGDGVDEVVVRSEGGLVLLDALGD